MKTEAWNIYLHSGHFTRLWDRLQIALHSGWKWTEYLRHLPLLFAFMLWAPCSGQVQGLFSTSGVTDFEINLSFCIRNIVSLSHSSVFFLLPFCQGIQGDLGEEGSPGISGPQGPQVAKSNAELLGILLFVEKYFYFYCSFFLLKNVLLISNFLNKNSTWTYLLRGPSKFNRLHSSWSSYTCSLKPAEVSEY